MADSGLILNITESPVSSVFHSGNKKYRKEFKNKTASSSHKNIKRKTKQINEEPSPKRRRENPVFQQKEKASTPPFSVTKPHIRSSPKVNEEPPAKQKSGCSVLQQKRNTNRTLSSVSKSPIKSSTKVYSSGKQNEDADEKSVIKTSSLFKFNPEIPEIHRTVVEQPRERVFTSDSFSELNLHPHLTATLLNVLKLTAMTSVQKQAIPILSEGKDALVRSQTGSGKTLAYGIPLVQSLQKRQPKIQRSDGPYAVIVVPTRELALQTFGAIQKLLKPFNWIVPGVLMGGEKRKSEKARLRKGINILISTPGRLVDHIKNTQSVHFNNVHWLILDEADRILDLGFEKDIAVILNALNEKQKSRQNVLLSATLTEGVTRLAGISLNDPVRVQITEQVHIANAADTKVEDETCEETEEGCGFTVPEKLKQHVVIVPSKLRLVTLAAFILKTCKFEKNQKVIIFFSSCDSVEFHHTIFQKVLCENLEGEELQPQPTFVSQLTFLRLHGNMEQEERMEVFQQFSQSREGILLCTDVAARGLDLPQVTWIVQYNAPVSPSEYVHRVGRSARIGCHGNSLLFLSPSEAEYITELAANKISISEIKMEDILSNLMLDERFKLRNGSKKISHSSTLQNVRERATVLQTKFENYVHSSVENVMRAKKALQSFIRAYTTYPSNLKHFFHIKALHLGHTAKSFGLRDAPQNLRASLIGSGEKKKNRHTRKRSYAIQSASSRKRVVNILRSEYSSGLVPVSSKAKKHKKRRTMEKSQNF
ncbi:probable ATP-dependent RNA helicase DDX31 [Protopterus annectens]|uniref:probable ATP-dependent RNA helicase DDX31 n=1 Tax=Protopterus annectens TaxID=7888 RepID=UPI001CF9422A|nr:probable ATP-dependent RNA helicase DDX31 [Protopterus annectens]